MRRLPFALALVLITVLIDAISVVAALWGALCIGIAVLLSMVGWSIKSVNGVLLTLGVMLSERLRR